ncbi:MAG TPA: GNAT family N-acetyltransferase [Anaerolineales bacterium]
MNIRQAAVTDSLTLSTLCMDVQKLHANAHPTIFKIPHSADFAKAFFDKMLVNDTSFIFIAEENEEALGYVFCNLVEKPENPFLFTRRHLMIEQISVRPQAQGRGVGASLMRQVEATARELGVLRVQLGSWDFNSNAHGFFERLGYEKWHFQFWRMLD